MFKVGEKSGVNQLAVEEAELSGRILTLFADGVAMNMPEIDPQAYKNFRTEVARLALQVPDRATEQDKLLVARQMVQEFELYRNLSREQLRERLSAWRALTGLLLRACIEHMHMRMNSPGVLALFKEILVIEQAGEIKNCYAKVEKFLTPPSKGKSDDDALGVSDPNLSTSNDNAAGLLGGGSAAEHLERILTVGGKGYVVQFELGCMDVIGQRFGAEAVQDCLIAVAAYITNSLHADDRIYHWSNSRLLAIVQGRANDQILTAELNRISGHNRDFTVNVCGRNVMLRIPLSFEVIPVSRFQSAEDLNKLQTKFTMGR